MRKRGLSETWRRGRRKSFRSKKFFALATAIRDRVYVAPFRAQEDEKERQRAKDETRHRQQVQELGALLQAARRKRLFIQQATHHAQAYWEEKQIMKWAHLSIVGDIESRLDEFLTGEEPIMEAQTIVQSVLEARFAEAEAQLGAARTKQDAKWRDEMLALLLLGTLASLVVLASKYPHHALARSNGCSAWNPRHRLARPRMNLQSRGTPAPVHLHRLIRGGLKHLQAVPQRPRPKPQWIKSNESKRADGAALYS